MTIDLAPFVGRDNLAPWLVSIGMADAGVEVGTDRGEFAETLLKGGVEKLGCLDPYRTGYDDNDATSSRPSREDDIKAAMAVIDRCRWKAILLIKTSEEGSKIINDGSLGFVYLDGCHLQDSVLTDLRLWWPKLRKGGVMAGHDFLTKGDSIGGFGRHGVDVQRAVLSFSQERSVPVFLIPEATNSPWSYYMVKP